MNEWKSKWIPSLYKVQRDYHVSKNCFEAGYWSLSSQNTEWLAFIFTFPAGSLVLCGHISIHLIPWESWANERERQSADLQTDKPGKFRLVVYSFQKLAGFSCPEITNSLQSCDKPLARGRPSLGTVCSSGYLMQFLSKEPA